MVKCTNYDELIRYNDARSTMDLVFVRLVLLCLQEPVLIRKICKLVEVELLVNASKLLENLKFDFFLFFCLSFMLSNLFFMNLPLFGMEFFL